MIVILPTHDDTLKMLVLVLREGISSDDVEDEIIVLARLTFFVSFVLQKYLGFVLFSFCRLRVFAPNGFSHCNMFLTIKFG